MTRVSCHVIYIPPTQSEEVWTVKDALEALSARETVHMSEVKLICKNDDHLL